MAKLEKIFSKSKTIWRFIIIYVTIGNDGRHFERLLDRIGELIKEDFDHIFVQFGNSRNRLDTSDKVKESIIKSL